MIALLNSNSPKLLNSIVNFMNECIPREIHPSQRLYNKYNEYILTLYIYSYMYVCKLIPLSLPHVLILYIFYMYIFPYVSKPYIVNVLVPRNIVYCL